MKVLDILEEYQIKPNLLKDQNFMVNEKALREIVELADIKPKDSILEIGPGLGNLSKHIMDKGCFLTAVEIDRRFRPVLERELKKYKKFKLVFGNVLKLIRKVNFNKIVSNLPYSICEPLLNEMFRKDFDLAVLSIPGKFFDTITSGERDKKYSLLSLKIQSFFRVEMAFCLGKGNFYPEPKTRSVVVKVEPLSNLYYRENQRSFILREILLKPKRKLKNALREAIISLNKNLFSKDFTKRESRGLIKKMELGRVLLDKRVEEMDLRDFKKIKV